MWNNPTIPSSSDVTKKLMTIMVVIVFLSVIAAIIAGKIGQALTDEYECKESLKNMRLRIYEASIKNEGVVVYPHIDSLSTIIGEIPSNPYQKNKDSSSIVVEGYGFVIYDHHFAMQLNNSCPGAGWCYLDGRIWPNTNTVGEVYW